MQRNINYSLISFRLLFTCIIGLYIPSTAFAQTLNIKNDVFWNTKEGRPIYSQGGGIFKFPDPLSGITKYYWYGVHYAEADSFRNNPTLTQKTHTFESVTCYSSIDLVNWSFEADVLTKEEVNKFRNTWVGRLGVAFIKEMNKYALFVQHGSKVLITVSNSPIGQFRWDQEISMEQMIGTSNTGDQTVFTDEENGKSYLVYSYGKGRNKIYLSEIGIKDGKINLLDCTQVFKGESREGNCVFKYNNRFYMCASNIYGWNSSYAYYLVADNIRGPYLPTNNMLVMNGCTADNSHITQTGFFFTIKGNKQETVIFCGDRWSDFAGNGIGYNQWCPLSFAGKVPWFNSVSSWILDVHTGQWDVANDNNYVKNGSFEADRNSIPSSFKPVQQELTGWTTIVSEGNQISSGSLESPTLNHFNTANDRKLVTGERCLYISDNINFARKIFQVIGSSPYVKMQDGFYTLTATVKNSTGFSKLYMYASSGGTTLKYRIENENITWQTIIIKNIPVRNGEVEIGFSAEGSPNAICGVDDVKLVME